MSRSYNPVYAMSTQPTFEARLQTLLFPPLNADGSNFLVWINDASQHLVPTISLALSLQHQHQQRRQQILLYRSPKSANGRLSSSFDDILTTLCDSSTYRSTTLRSYGHNCTHVLITNRRCSCHKQEQIG
jgi:hypothetical protein